MFIPDQEGYYWARWIKKAPGTIDYNDETSGEWEIVDVFENCYDEDDPEHLMVLVHGVEMAQPLQNFQWGDIINPSE